MASKRRIYIKNTDESVHTGFYPCNVRDASLQLRYTRVQTQISLRESGKRQANLNKLLRKTIQKAENKDLFQLKRIVIVKTVK
jgi:hypothetical protein